MYIIMRHKYLSPWPTIYCIQYLNLTIWVLSTFQDYLYHSWVIDPLIVWSLDIPYLIKSICLKQLLDHNFPKHISLRLPNGTHYLKLHEISWCFYWKYLLPPTFINIDSIYREYVTHLRISSVVCQSHYKLWHKFNIFFKVERPYNITTWWNHDYLIVLCHHSP